MFCIQICDVPYTIYSIAPAGLPVYSNNIRLNIAPEELPILREGQIRFKSYFYPMSLASKFLSLYFFLFICLFAKAQVVSTHLFCDSVSRVSFFNIANDVRKNMDEVKLLSTEKVLKIVKVYNTFFLAKTITNQREQNLADSFRVEFEAKCVSEVMKRLETTFGKGMTIYSSKYDIYVGVPSQSRCKDFYTIREQVFNAQ